MKVRIYTDGACSENPGPGGWAAVFNDEYDCQTISGGEESTTNNRMELKAVIKAFEKILNHPKGAEFELFSDSAYVVNSINNGWIDKWLLNDWKTTKGDSVKNKDLWEQFIELNREIKDRNISVKLVKIKGHSGNTFNELVDKLAKEESLKFKDY